ncbi:hypothetical protein ACPVPU_11155 [Sphingomonas sp. CJ99]
MILASIGFVALAIIGNTPTARSADPVVAGMVGLSFIFALMVVGWTSVSSKMAISMQTMMLYFAIFLALPGYSHLMHNQFPFVSTRYSNDIIRQSSFILILFLVASTWGYIAASRFVGRAAPRGLAAANRLFPNQLLATGIVMAAYIGTIGYVATVGIGQVFSLRGDVQLVNVNAAGSGLLIAMPRIICVVALAYSISIWRFTQKRQLGIVLTMASLLPGIIALWPPILPRSTLFGFILLISMLFIDFSKINNRLFLSIVYFGGAVIAMPVVNAITRGEQSLFDLSFSDIFSVYVISGDFDGLQSMNNAILFTEFEGYQWGLQLLSAIFFFVPRLIWPSKADPTGAVAADLAGYKFVNVSMPLPAEFYVDFGIGGVVAGGLVVGWILCRIDHFINANWHANAKGRLVAGASVGYAIALYRGTLIGVVAPIAVLAALIWIINGWGFYRRSNRGPLPAR